MFHLERHGDKLETFISRIKRIGGIRHGLYSNKCANFCFHVSFYFIKSKGRDTVEGRGAWGRPWQNKLKKHM